MNKREKGYLYEEHAMDFFVEKGYKILEKNYTTRVGEIDFIAENSFEVVFVEVKYRKNNNFGTGAEAITKKKLEKIYLTSKKYIYENRIIKKDIRYDLVMFTGEELQWIKDIMRGDEIGCNMS